MKMLLLKSFIVFNFAIFINNTSVCQNHELFLKSGIINSTTKTQQIDPPYGFHFGSFKPRTGGLFGARYSYKLSRHFSVGTEFQYILKGYTEIDPINKVYSNHYLGLSPYFGINPLTNSKSKFISCVSVELGLDYNYSLGTNAPFKLYDNIKFYNSELGYSMKITYLPTRVGLQIFHFRSLTPFLKSQWGPPPFDDLKYNFVTGLSILYKIL